MNLGLTIEAKQTNKVRSKHFETASTYFRAHHVWKLKNLIAYVKLHFTLNITGNIFNYHLSNLNLNPR